jgi:hypothetical protein
MPGSQESVTRVLGVPYCPGFSCWAWRAELAPWVAGGDLHKLCELEESRIPTTADAIGRLGLLGNIGQGGVRPLLMSHRSSCTNKSLINPITTWLLMSV